MPLPAEFRIFMFVNDGLSVLVSAIPWLVAFWIVPPDPSPPTDVLPPPVTVSPPLAPVLFRTMPLAAPLDEMLLNVSPLAPMVVFATFRAVPVCELIVLFDPVTLTVPPPVALNPVPLVVVIARLPLLKVIVPPVLLVRLTAVAVVVDAVTEPPNVVVPPDLALIWTALAALLWEIVPL